MWIWVFWDSLATARHRGIYGTQLRQHLAPPAPPQDVVVQKKIRENSQTFSTTYAFEHFPRRCAPFN